jgi:ankyrin repeat protein
MKNLIVWGMVFCGSLIEAAAQDAKTILQEGLFAEEAEQKLDKAAASYEKIIGQYDAQRTYAVAALYRLAEVRRKQERNDDAAVLYKRILEEFSDADPQARLSKENLIAMGVAVEPAQSMPNDPDEDKELRRLMMLAENRPEKVWEPVPQAINNSGSATMSVLSKAARLGWLRVGAWLLENARASERSDQEELDAALREAALSGHLAGCQLLLSHGANIAAASDTLVHAIQNNFDSVSEWLIENGVNINSVGLAELAAIDGRKTERVNPSTGAKENVPFTRAFRMSPLAAAIAEDDKLWVDRLLEQKAEVNVIGENESDLTALAVACWKGHVPLVRTLLALGADPNAVDSGHPDLIRTPMIWGDGWTPLHYGARDSGMVSVLLEASADPNIANSTGITPLHMACYFGNVKAVKELLEAGADANALGTFRRERSRNLTMPLCSDLLIFQAS